MGVVYIGVVDISRHLKDLVWATDKRLQDISNIMLFKNSYNTEELKNNVVLSSSMHCYICGPPLDCISLQEAVL